MAFGFTNMPASRPCEELLGLELDGGWKVVQKLQKQPGATGSCFSQGYIVEASNGKQAFLKAIDFLGAMFSSDPARELQELTAAYNFERDVLMKCKRFDRVVSAISDGKTTVPSFGPFGTVVYLIFERATGDVRSFSAYSNQFDTAFALRALHHITNGIKQLHGASIAHQDLKPSNVLVFDDKISKVADLGRAAAKGEVPPHEAFPLPGDPTYAPPEQLYGYVNAEWNARRLGCDAYLLGSMIVYFFTGMPTTHLLFTELQDPHKWNSWKGDYKTVLPYIRDAFDRVMEIFEQQLPQDLRGPLGEIVRQLCEPDPDRRGDPKSRAIGANPFQMDRYVTRFDVLARNSELKMRR